MTLDARWPLPALPIPSHDPWRCVRLAVYDLACVADLDPAHAPSLAALVCDGLRSQPRADLPRVLASLDAAGVAAPVVGILVGAVLRMESARVAHMLCPGAENVERAVRAMSPSMVFRGMPSGRAGVA